MPIHNLVSQIWYHVSDYNCIFFRIFHKRVQDLNYRFVDIFPRCVGMIFLCLLSVDSSLSFATRFDSNSTPKTHVLNNILNCIELSLNYKVSNPVAARSKAAARLLRLRVRIPPESMYICLLCLLCVLSGSGLCDGLITRPEEPYRLWCVWVWSCSLDNEEALAHWGLSGQVKVKMPTRN